MDENLRKQVFAKYNGHCAYCGKAITIRQMQIDHFVPLRRRTSQEAIDRFNRNNVQQIKKGTNDLSNLMPACEICNTVKGEKTLDKFRQIIQTIGKDTLKGKNAKLSLAYGLVEYHPHSVKFYFEQSGR